MKTSKPLSAIVSDGPSAPIVSGRNWSASAKQITPIVMDKRMSKMRVTIIRMQQQTKRIWAATDPKVRQKLLHVYVQTLQESMKIMRSMGAR